MMWDDQWAEQWTESPRLKHWAMRVGQRSAQLVEPKLPNQRLMQTDQAKPRHWVMWMSQRTDHLMEQLGPSR
jgi:hypothetical protein